MNEYFVGETIKISCEFKVGSTLTDPTTVTLKVKDPAGTATTYTYAGATVSKESTGIFYRDHNVTSKGKWSYRWEGTGTVVTASEGEFRVKPTMFA